MMVNEMILIVKNVILNDEFIQGNKETLGVVNSLKISSLQSITAR